MTLSCDDPCLKSLVFLLIVSEEILLRVNVYRSCYCWDLNSEMIYVRSVSLRTSYPESTAKLSLRRLIIQSGKTTPNR
jgi:hypothetical protein